MHIGTKTFIVSSIELEPSQITTSIFSNNFDYPSTLKFKVSTPQVVLINSTLAREVSERLFTFHSRPIIICMYVQYHHQHQHPAAYHPFHVAWLYYIMTTKYRTTSTCPLTFDHEPHNMTMNHMTMTMERHGP